MSIQFNCRSCGKKYKVADNLAGKKAKCTGCKSVMLVPQPEQEEEIIDLAALEEAESKSLGFDDSLPDTSLDEVAALPTSGKMLSPYSQMQGSSSATSRKKTSSRKNKVPAIWLMVVGGSVLAIAACIGIAVLVYVMWPESTNSAEANLIAHIEELGGKVSINEPAKLGKLIGEKRSVEEENVSDRRNFTIDLSGSKASDEDLLLIREFFHNQNSRHLKYLLVGLDCSGTQITDAGILYFSGNSTLSYFRVADSKVTAEGVAAYNKTASSQIDFEQPSGSKEKLLPDPEPSSVPGAYRFKIAGEFRKGKGSDHELALESIKPVLFVRAQNNLWEINFFGKVWLGDDDQLSQLRLDQPFPEVSAQFDGVGSNILVSNSKLLLRFVKGKFTATLEPSPRYFPERRVPRTVTSQSFRNGVPIGPARVRTEYKTEPEEPGFLSLACNYIADDSESVGPTPVPNELVPAIKKAVTFQLGDEDLGSDAQWQFKSLELLESGWGVHGRVISKGKKTGWSWTAELNADDLALKRLIVAPDSRDPRNIRQQELPTIILPQIEKVLALVMKWNASEVALGNLQFFFVPDAPSHWIVRGTATVDSISHEWRCDVLASSATSYRFQCESITVGDVHQELIGMIDLQKQIKVHEMPLDKRAILQTTDDSSTPQEKHPAKFLKSFGRPAIETAALASIDGKLISLAGKFHVYRFPNPGRAKVSWTGNVLENNTVSFGYWIGDRFAIREVPNPGVVQQFTFEVERPLTEKYIYLFVSCALAGPADDVTISTDQFTYTSIDRVKKPTSTIKFTNIEPLSPIGITAIDTEKNRLLVQDRQGFRFLDSVTGDLSSECLDQDKGTIINTSLPNLANFNFERPSALSHDLKKLAYWDGTQLVICHTVGKKLIRNVAVSQFAGSITFQNDGNSLFVLEYVDSKHVIRRISVEGGRLNQKYSHRGKEQRIYKLAVSSDGERLVAAGDGEFIVWNTKRGNKEIKRIPRTSIISFGMGYQINQMFFSPNGQHLVCFYRSTTVASKYANISILNIIKKTVDHYDGKYHTCDFSPDGKYAVFGSDQGIDVVRVSDGKTVHNFSVGAVRNLAVNREGKIVIPGAKNGLQWLTIPNIESSDK